MSDWKWIVEIDSVEDRRDRNPEIIGVIVIWNTRSTYVEGSGQPALPRAGQRFKLVPDDDSEDDL